MTIAAQTQGLGIGKRMQHLRNSLKSDGSLSPTQRHLLLSLFTYSNDLGVCYPSYTELEEFTGLSRPAISKNLKILVEKKWLTYVKGSARSKKANTYTFAPEKIGINTENVVMFPNSNFQQDRQFEDYQQFGYAN